MKRLAFAAALVLFAAVGAPTAAADPGTVIADVDGRPISADKIPDYFCHDRQFPQIHCFKTSARLQEALATSARSSAALAATDYVVVFSSPSYAGSYFYISQNYDALVVVGWNDRIRSYRALNGDLGIFWTDWLANGTGQTFCCNQTVPILSTTFDHQISSVYRR